MRRELFAIGKFYDLQHNQNSSFFDKVKTVLKTYGFIVLFLISVSPVIIATEHFVTGVLHLRSIQKQNTESFDQMLKRTGYVVAIVYICFIGPILEETVFRLPLSFKRVHIALSLSIAVLLFGTAISVKSLLPAIAPAYIVLIRVAFSGVIFFISYRLLANDIKIGAIGKKTIIILSICLFGLMHISNFAPLQWQLIWIYPVYVLPQLGMGWALSYIRFKNGFIWGIALHCLINSVAMALSSYYIEPAKPKAKQVVTKTDSSHLKATKTPAHP